MIIVKLKGYGGAIRDYVIDLYQRIGHSNFSRDYEVCFDIMKLNDRDVYNMTIKVSDLDFTLEHLPFSDALDIVVEQDNGVNLYTSVRKKGSHRWTIEPVKKSSSVSLKPCICFMDENAEFNTAPVVAEDIESFGEYEDVDSWEKRNSYFYRGEQTDV